MGTELASAQNKTDIKVESYQHVASMGGWAGGGRTLWAISSLSAIIGAGMGAVAPLFPLIAVGAAGLPAALAAIPVSMAAFAAIGLSTGFAGGLMLGRISGSSAAVAQEQEKRLKEWTAAQLKHNNPGAEIVQPTPKNEAPLSAKEKYLTYFNPKVGLVMAAIGAVGGLLMGTAFILTGGAAGALMPALGTLTGISALGSAAVPAAGAIAANSAAIMAYSVGVMATFGSLWTLNLPKITNNMTEFFGDLVSGKLTGREWGKEPARAQASEPEIAQAPQLAVQTPAAERSVSYRDLIAKQQTAEAASILNR